MIIVGFIISKKMESLVFELGHNLAQVLDYLDYKLHHFYIPDNDKFTYCIYIEIDDDLEKDFFFHVLNVELRPYGFIVAVLEHYKDKDWMAFVWVRLEGWK